MNNSRRRTAKQQQPEEQMQTVVVVIPTCYKKVTDARRAVEPYVKAMGVRAKIVDVRPTQQTDLGGE